MARTLCGFNDVPGLSGAQQLVGSGPTLFVRIGFDPNYDPSKPHIVPILPDPPFPALVDTGATASCIDSGLAMRLNLPVVDRQMIAGSKGNHEVNMHVGQIHIPSLNRTVYGSFAGVDLVAGGQAHHALIGRTFLMVYTMIYEGRTGSVTLHDE